VARTPILVTKPSLPSLADVLPYLEKIWESRVLTNSGHYHRELESALSKYLGVEHLSLFTNGMIALMTALKTLNLSGEIITTPYSFVATAHAVLWNGLTPVFVDVDPQTLNIDPDKIEAAISPRTSAILPVHCYGTPCDTGAIQDAAERHGLKVVYDAAHAFAVQDAGGSVLRHGDLSVLSFHATKVFNTFEGGAIISPDQATKDRVDQLKNFGIFSETEVIDVGLNGKMSELQAVIGLLQLKQVTDQMARRSFIDARYRNALHDVEGIRCLQEPKGVQRNYSYFPILVDERYPMTRDRLYDRLAQEGVKARRYFYPLITDFPVYCGLPSADPENLPIASRSATQVLCLPIYPDLAVDDVDHICRVIAKGCDA
jgi:dTDP-4-amino-4,6-dideoxygalactose transaminase